MINLLFNLYNFQNVYQNIIKYGIKNIDSINMIYFITNYWKLIQKKILFFLISRMKNKNYNSKITLAANVEHLKITFDFIIKSLWLNNLSIF